jgi:hypothetical protein
MTAREYLQCTSCTLGAIALLGACGSEDGTSASAMQHDNPLPTRSASRLQPQEALPPLFDGSSFRLSHAGPALVRSSTSIRDGEIVVSLRNSTNIAGHVSVGFTVANRRGTFHTDGALVVPLEGAEVTETQVSPGSVEGLDISSLDWLDVTVSYEAQLDDGRSSEDWQTVSVEDVQIARPQPARAIRRPWPTDAPFAPATAHNDVTAQSSDLAATVPRPTIVFFAPERSAQNDKALAGAATPPRSRLLKGALDARKAAH